MPIDPPFVWLPLDFELVFFAIEMPEVPEVEVPEMPPIRDHQYGLWDHQYGCRGGNRYEKGEFRNLIEKAINWPIEPFNSRE